MEQKFNKVRLDKWLWAARFFKTRALATNAIKGGKISLNGQHVKPGKEIQTGVILKIRQGMFVIEIVVNALSQRRGPASDAQALYEETEQSRLDATKLKERLKNQAVILPQQKGRPNKRNRQKIIQFNRKHITE